MIVLITGRQIYSYINLRDSAVGHKFWIVSKRNKGTLSKETEAHLHNFFKKDSFKKEPVKHFSRQVVLERAPL